MLVKIVKTIFQCSEPSEMRKIMEETQDPFPRAAGSAGVLIHHILALICCCHGLFWHKFAFFGVAMQGVVSYILILHSTTKILFCHLKWLEILCRGLTAMPATNVND